jgi:NAD(P)-dependent dehydrogenase (short-subunit alcohol dehydrogenase family)
VSHGFESKVVAITGAGKGLGRAYALCLAQMGARIVVNNRRHGGETESSADRVVAEIGEIGGSAAAEYSSVEDPGAGERLLSSALGAFGRLDALIANAGVSEGCSFHKQDMADFRQVIEINLMGTANVLQAAFRHMYEQGSGAIVVSTSVAGLYGEHGLPAYSASKAGLLGLMYSLSKEGEAHGIRVNALAPFANTQMTEKDLPESLKRELQPDHVAPVAAWLISDQCSLTGETIITGGGRISRARNMETSSRDLKTGTEYQPNAIRGAWEELAARPLEQAYAGALEQFGKFISGSAS